MRNFSLCTAGKHDLNLLKGNDMASKQKSGNQQSGSQGNASRPTGTQGGTHEQHVEAGRQSHKNDAKGGSKQSGAGSGNKQSTSKR